MKYKITIDDLELIIVALNTYAGIEEYNGRSGKQIERIDELAQILKIEVENEKEQYDFN